MLLAEEREKEKKEKEIQMKLKEVNKNSIVPIDDKKEKQPSKQEADTKTEGGLVLDEGSKIDLVIPNREAEIEDLLDEIIGGNKRILNPDKDYNLEAEKQN